MRKRRLAARALELLDVVVPRECAGCGGVIVAPALICERCQKHLRLPPRQISLVRFPWACLSGQWGRIQMCAAISLSR